MSDGGADGDGAGHAQSGAAPSRRRARVVVIGGGVAGLVTARTLVRGGVDVVLLESGDELGGKLRPLTVAGITMDAGAESFATRGGTVAALATELGLADDIVTPSAAGAWLQPARGRAVPLPKAGLLGIPSIPLARDVIAVVGVAGAIRAQLDALLPGQIGAKERSLGALVRKRMGSAVLDLLVAPVATAIHARHPDDLDVDRVAPTLRDGVRERSSLAHAVLAQREAAPAGSAALGIAGGIHRIADALAAEVRDRAEVRLRSRVAAILDTSAETTADAAGGTPSSGAVRVELDDKTSLSADYVVAATRLPDSVVPGAPDSAPRVAPEATSITLATLVVDEPALDAAPRGTGVLVAAGAPGFTAKALTHATAKWQWLADSASGRHVVRLSYDGAPRDDEELRELARTDAERLLGVSIPQTSVVGFARVAWAGPADAVDSPPVASTPQRIIHTGERVAGTGLAAVIRHATSQSESLLKIIAGDAGLRWSER
ncbi:protoporphyrinogen/coproporphyrinogen oxidase [Marisediminicola sp. LYQ134]|uniref:protoporphyrinogen/coproporphyrinogen oxidase n=1 Tax=Marisediminicola sp. LYQ134 TaxID=3391061 RepID=UPI0039838AE7